MTNPEEKLKSYVRDVPGFPQEGIIFRDITPLLSDHEIFNYTIEQMVKDHLNKGITKVVALESRGFIFAPVAIALKAGLILIRKSGKLPRETFTTSYDLEYGSATIEMHTDCMTGDDTALIVDDVLATGGTAEAASMLVKLSGAKLYGYQFLIELDGLNGREKLTDAPVFSLLHY